VDGEKVVWCVGDDVKGRAKGAKRAFVRLPLSVILIVKEASEGGNRVKEKRESFLASISPTLSSTF